VELSIVIVIIGLLVAGVVGGRTLVHQSKLRSQITQFRNFEVAYNSFFLEYNAVPGDFANAQDFWGAGNTDNGDGDGSIEKADGSIAMANGTFSGEAQHTFEHLSLAGMINKQYVSSNVINIGFPSAKIEDGLGILMGSNYGSGAWQQHCDYRGNGIIMLIIAYGNPSALPALDPADGMLKLKPADAANIDKKIDGGEGDAIGGKFVGINTLGNLSHTCHNNGAYQVQNDFAACRACYYLR